jgi:hypothetical protein
MKEIPQTALSGHILKKSAHTLLVYGHFSWSMFNLHLVRGPKALKNAIFKKADHIIVIMKCDHGTMPSNMGQLHGL